MAELKIDYEEIREKEDDYSLAKRSDIGASELTETVNETNKSIIVKNNLYYSTKARDNGEFYGVVDTVSIGDRPTQAQINNMTDDNDFIISKKEDGYELIQVETYDKRGIVPQEKIEEHDELIDGSYINSDEQDERISNPKEYVEDNEFLSTVSEFERLDRENKAEALKKGEDPRTVNENQYDVVTYRDEVIVVRNDNDQNRLQRDTIGIPSDEDGDEYYAVVNSLKGRRTSINGVPVGSMDKQELIDKTGADNIDEGIEKLQGANLETIDEIFTNKWKDKNPTEIDLWSKFVEEDTELNDKIYLPTFVQLSEVYGVNKKMTAEEYKSETVTKEQVMLTFSTRYIESKESVEAIFEEFDSDGNIEIDDIVKHLPDKIDEDDKPQVARKLLPRLQAIEHRFEQSDEVEFDEDGTAGIALSSAPVIGVGYSTYTYWVVQTINNKTYRNGPYYQSSYRDSFGQSSSKYHRIVSSFDADKTVKNIN